MNSSQPGETADKVEEQLKPHPTPPDRFAEPNKTITMATIAKAAGVSQGAISSLLNDRDYGIRVSEKTRERVFRVCRELRYLPNDLRAVVRMYPELGDFCFLISNDFEEITADPFVSRMMSSAMKAVNDPCHCMVFAQFDPNVDYMASPPDLPLPIRSGTASKFICAGTVNLSLLQALTKRSFPVVVLGTEVKLPGVTCLVPDYAEASRLAIRHLHGLGHRQIAILSGPFGTRSPQIIELNRGVRLGFEDIDVPVEAQNIVYGDLSFKSGVRSMDMLLDRKPTVTAVFCMSDAVAAGALSRAQARGLRIPVDLSIIGCSNDHVGQCIYPSLTTVHIPGEEMGSAGVREIERRVRTADILGTGTTMMPVRLVDRESCASLTVT